MNKNKFFVGLLFLVCFIIKVEAQVNKEPEFLQYQHSQWVDSIMGKLTPDERVAQLFMARAHSNLGEAHERTVLKLVEDQKIGGLIFFQGDPKSQVKLMNGYQNAAKVPLLGAIDAEWGLGMRLDSTMSFPYQMALGAIGKEGDSLLFAMGQEVARQVKRVGLQMNFAPVVDVNNNPNNPVINYRSFGENKEKVAQKGVAYMQGMQSEHLLTTAKHFPGHGDTDTDSHFALPQINHSYQRLDSLEMYPFKELIKAGIGGVMVAHLNIPALDSTQVPSTLSKPIITGILKNKLDFKGLIITDAMDMKGVTSGHETGDVDKKAIMAGNDVLELTEDIPKAIAEIRKAINTGLISQAEIDARCRKMLAVKQWVGLNSYTSTPEDNLMHDLHKPSAQLLHKRLVEASLTVLKNEYGLLPLQKLDTLKIASISFGAAADNSFQRSLKLYTKTTDFQVSENASAKEIEQIRKELENFNLIIGSIHDNSSRPLNALQFSVPVVQFITEISQKKHTILGIFKNPYVLDKIDQIENTPGLIVAYQDSPVTQQVLAELIFGGVGANGRLPVSVGEKFKSGDGLDIKPINRFEYTLPEAVGMDSAILTSGIDSLMHQAINAKAMPGGVVLVAKDNKVVFHKAYGLHRYSDTVKVKLDDLYDLASVTKISSALPALMELYDENKFSLDAGIDTYLPYFKHSNKAGIPFRQILAHQARFAPWIPYWKNTLRKNGSHKWATFKKDSSRRFPLKVSNNMWLHRNYQKKIFKAIRKSPLLNEAKYTYSGLAFYLMPAIVEDITGEDFNTYIHEHFYDKLGATSLTYNPASKFPLKSIVPTEDDFLFRHSAIHGTVHDEGAIMMGGISANAGLFSNANDLAKLMQMYLNMGDYGGEHYINKSTMEAFTTVQFPDNENRRGLGFDKPNLQYKGADNNTAKGASASSFGHTGFTGTMVWMDPAENLLYIFLSNRVLPTRENGRLYDLNTRTQIQQVLYDAIKTSPQNKQN